LGAIGANGGVRREADAGPASTGCPGNGVPTNGVPTGHTKWHAMKRDANGTHQMAREHGGGMAKRERGGGGRREADAGPRLTHEEVARVPFGVSQWHNAWRPWHNGVLVGGCERRQPRLRRERKAAMGSTRTPRRLALTARSPWMLAT